MQISLTQLQGYNVMYKLLDQYHKETNLDDLAVLLGAMCFLIDGSTADPAIWHDWLDAIQNKKILTKQEAFDGMISFFEIYQDIGPSDDVKAFLDEIYLAKDCNDIRFPLIREWNLYLKEVLREPEGSRKYLTFVKK